MASYNENYEKLQSSYLFSEIAKRTKAFQEANKDTKIFRLGIGNTTHPLPRVVIDGLKSGVERLGRVPQPGVPGYSGYGDEQGNTELREAIAKHYLNRGVKINPQNVFVSDGAKSDLGNLLSIFGKDDVVAIQDPVYPAYLDTTVMSGRSGNFNKDTGKYDGVVYMPCNESNNFFPEFPFPLKGLVDIIFLCNPNNPTGAVATRSQLEEFVSSAFENCSVIIYDAAYADYILDKSLPQSIYEIPHAKDCCIEVRSFSKSAGFTGVRLGWTVVPSELGIDGTNELRGLWNRRQTTFFNGASNIAQDGGMAVLTKEGQEQCGRIIDYYMENARIIRDGLDKIGIKYFGGVNAPYIWAKTPNRMKSWDFFDKLLNETHIVGTPGAGFGPEGEGFFRFSAYGVRENVLEAVQNLKNLKL